MFQKKKKMKFNSLNKVRENNTTELFVLEVGRNLTKEKTKEVGRNCRTAKTVHLS